MPNTEYTVARISDTFGVPSRTVRTWIREKGLKAHKSRGGRYGIIRRDFVEFIYGHEPGDPVIDHIRETIDHVTSGAGPKFFDRPQYSLYLQCLGCGRFMGSAKTFDKPFPNVADISHGLCKKCLKRYYGNSVKQSEKRDKR